MAALLHIPTLILVAGLGSVCVFMTMAYSWLSDRRRPEIGLWALGYGVFALAALMIALRGQIPAFASVTVGNGLLLCAQGLHWLGYRQFTRGDSRRWVVPAFTAAAVWLIFAAAGIGYDDVNVRSAVISLLSVGNTVVIPVMLWRHYAREPLPSLRPTAAIALLHCASLTLRATVILIAPLPPGANPFQASLPVALSMLESALFLVFMGTMQMAIVGQRSERRFRIASETDELTGLCNRRHFIEQMVPSLRLAPTRGALLLFDLDHFKNINDFYGHSTGDRVLVAFAGLIAGEIAAPDLFARTGGEEFVLFCPSATAGTAEELAADLCRKVAALRIESRDGTPVRITTSCGVASVADSGGDYGTLLINADQALYDAKQAGRDRVCIFNGRRPTTWSLPLPQPVAAGVVHRLPQRSAAGKTARAFPPE